MAHRKVPITPALRDLITQSIGSVEELEILCLLSSAPRRTWSAEEVLRVVQSSPQSVARRLRDFHDRGFLQLDGNGLYRFAPRSSQLAQDVTALAEAYREQRVTVTKLIYNKPPIRTPKRLDGPKRDATKQN